MIELKRDGEYVVEGTNVKAEYIGESAAGNPHFLIDGLVNWCVIGGGIICSCGAFQGKRIIEKPKTYTVTVYVYETERGGVFASSSEYCDEDQCCSLKVIGIHEITAPYGTGL